jgi:hypothetical protein
MIARGMLLSFSDPTAGLVPTMVPFQYNPAEVTRVLRVVPGQPGGPGLRVGAAPTETYTLKIELDALGAPDKALTRAMGVGPLLATLEAMMEPAGRSGLLGALVGAVTAAVSLGGASLGGAVAPVPAPSLPLVVLAWSPERIVPVRIESYSAHETGFDELLQPVQATVDLSLVVLRDTDLAADLVLARVLANAYQAARSALAVVGVAQGVEVMS